MASPQVNFYLMPNEQQWFEDLLRSVGPMRVITRMENSSRPQFASTTVVRAFGQEDLMIHLARDADLDQIRAVEVPNRNTWYLDVLRSQVIEYSRCYTDGKILRRGRLYFVPKYYDDAGRLVEKDPEFLKWGRAVIARVRRAMERREDGDYMSAGAAQQARTGGLLLTAL